MLDSVHDLKTFRLFDFVSFHHLQFVFDLLDTNVFQEVLDFNFEFFSVGSGLIKLKEVFLQVQEVVMLFFKLCEKGRQLGKVGGFKDLLFFVLEGLH
jgi:hypothetical protein